MNERLTESIKNAAYLQWEETNHTNELDHWYCAEDIACFFEGSQLFTEDDITTVLRKGRQDMGYVEFVRQVAFRLFSYANIVDADANWYSAEKLLHNIEWRCAITQAARIYAQSKLDPEFLGQLRSEKVRKYYMSLQL